MLEIWWIRHGVTEWNREGRWQGESDLPLSGEGREQAQRLGARLRTVRFDAVWSSNLERCVETARLSVPNADVRLDPRLRELSVGCLEGLTWDEVPEAHRQAVNEWWLDPYGAPFPGGAESLGDVARRVVEWRGELPGTGRVAAFTHGGVIRASLWSITGPPQRRSWRVDLDNTSLTRIRYEGGRVAVLSVNDAAHLEEGWNPEGPPGV